MSMAEGREDALWAGALAAALLSEPGEALGEWQSSDFLFRLSACGRMGVFQLRRISPLPVDGAASPVKLGEVQGVPKIHITDSRLGSAGTRRRSMEQLWVI